MKVSTWEDPEFGSPEAIVIYELNREMQPIHVTYSDLLKSRHPIRETEGKLDHPYRMANSKSRSNP